MKSELAYTKVEDLNCFTETSLLTKKNPENGPPYYKKFSRLLTVRRIYWHILKFHGKQPDKNDELKERSMFDLNS